jgi:hypothetical protein
MKKQNAKRSCANKQRTVTKLTATHISAPPTPFWNRWTFRALVGGLVVIAGGASAVVKLRITCPPGTAICVHGPGSTNLDGVGFSGFARDVGIDGGSLSVRQSENVGPAGKPRF